MASIRNLESNLQQLEAVRAELLRPGRGAHMVGVGGVGMAGLAVHLAHRGFVVSGCDSSRSSRILSWLQQSGVAVAVGHSGSHLSAGTGFVVRTAAVRDDAPWELLRRTDGTVAKRVGARDLWEQVGHAAWACWLWPGSALLAG